MDAHPSFRYGMAALFVAAVAARDVYVLVKYTPASTSAWVAFSVGAAITSGPIAYCLWKLRQPSNRLIQALLVIAVLLVIFGLVEGLGWSRFGTTYVADETNAIRSFALGAAWGSAALIGLAGHRAAQMAKKRRTERSNYV